MLEKNSEHRRKIAVHVLSMAEGGAGNVIKEADVEQSHKDNIQDITVFKSSHGMYPLVQPYINISRKGKKCKL